MEWTGGDRHGVARQERMGKAWRGVAWHGRRGLVGRGEGEARTGRIGEDGRGLARVGRHG
jgi:hypothetical protein